MIPLFASEQNKKKPTKQLQIYNSAISGTWRSNVSSRRAPTYHIIYLVSVKIFLKCIVYIKYLCLYSYY